MPPRSARRWPVLRPGCSGSAQAAAGVDFENQPRAAQARPVRRRGRRDRVCAEPGAGELPDTDDEIGWGRFVLLYDPAGQTGWDGPFRIIAYVRADLEPEIAADPLIGQVGWSWLTEALDARAAGYRQPSGTVTRVVTEGFGAKQGEPDGDRLRAAGLVVAG